MRSWLSLTSYPSTSLHLRMYLTGKLATVLILQSCFAPCLLAVVTMLMLFMARRPNRSLPRTKVWWIAHLIYSLMKLMIPTMMQMSSRWVKPSKRMTLTSWLLKSKTSLLKDLSTMTELRIEEELKNMPLIYKQLPLMTMSQTTKKRTSMDAVVCTLGFSWTKVAVKFSTHSLLNLPRVAAMKQTALHITQLKLSSTTRTSGLTLTLPVRSMRSISNSTKTQTVSGSMSWFNLVLRRMKKMILITMKTWAVKALKRVSWRKSCSTCLLAGHLNCLSTKISLPMDVLTVRRLYSTRNARLTSTQSANKLMGLSGESLFTMTSSVLFAKKFAVSIKIARTSCIWEEDSHMNSNWLNIIRVQRQVSTYESLCKLMPNIESFSTTIIETRMELSIVKNR